MDPIAPVTLAEASAAGSPRASMQGAIETTATSGEGWRQTLGNLTAPLNEPFKTPDQMRREMLSAVDLSDPLKTMFVITDYGIEAHGMFAKLHISTSLASAATSLFGSLLKNQQQ
jgi:hypothetical protein